MDITKASLALPIVWGTLLFLLLSTRRKSARLLGGELVPDRDFSNSFKGIATFLVLYHHSYLYHPESYWYLFGGGEFFTGVSLFFFISGVGLSLSQGARPSTFSRFIGRRFWVLAPLVFLCMEARAILGPLMGRELALETSVVTLLGMREWYLVAIWCWYLLFIVVHSTIASRTIRNILFLCIGGALWGGLQWAAQDNYMAAMWLRFPLSFMLGVMLADRMTFITSWLQKGKGLAALTVMLLCGAGYLAFAGVGHWQTPWGYAILELLIIPTVWSMCVLFLLYVGVSRFLLVLGIYSLPIYLLQVPLIRYGVWFSPQSGPLTLLGTWGGIILGSILLQEMAGTLKKVVSSIFPAHVPVVGRLR